jgi:uncharacterized membrane protein YcaP (DUF421 family)
MSELRQQGFEDVAQVGRAYIEPDGNISVIPMNGVRPDVGRKH